MSNKIINPIIERKSTLAFVPKSIPKQDIDMLFEASRWAPSSYNEQPWRFYYVSREQGDAFNRMVNSLAPGNSEWAKNSSLLVFTTAKQTLTLNGNKNGYAKHDVGLATANLLAQATAMGLATHPMGGFDREKVVELLNLSDDFAPVSVIAVGYMGDFEKLSESNQKRELAERKRKELDEIRFEIK
jgi:nitroreductase